MSFRVTFQSSCRKNDRYLRWFAICWVFATEALETYPNMNEAMGTPLFAFRLNGLIADIWFVKLKSGSRELASR